MNKADTKRHTTKKDLSVLLPLFFHSAIPMIGQRVIQMSAHKNSELRAELAQSSPQPFGPRAMLSVDTVIPHAIPINPKPIPAIEHFI
jgi:hypothetical protein